MISALALALAHAAPVRMAVVVGSNEGRAPELPLLYAERDAERMAELLVDLGGFCAEDVVVLRTPGADRVREVLDELARRAEWARARGEETLLLVYYSGHADEAALHLGTTDLPLSELKAGVEAVPVDVRLLLVDACRSGELTRLKGAVQVEPFVIEAEDHIASEGTVIITASSPGEDAQESDRLGGGVFTHHLLAGLAGAADTSGDGEVTLTEAYRYGYAGTLRSTSTAPTVQHPTYAFDLRGRDDLVLTRLDAARRTGRVTFAEGGTWVLLPSDETDGGVLELTLPPGGTVAVPPGDWIVRLREPEGLLEGRLEVGRGEILAVERGDLAAVPYGTTVRRGLEEDRRAALALSAGAGVVGATLPGLPASPEVLVGARLDLEPLSLAARVGAGRARSENDTLALVNDRVGVDLTAVKWVDLGRVAPGVGVAVGGDLVAQRFDTRGVAPARMGLTGRLGPWLGVDLLVARRASLSLSGGADVAVYQEVDGALAAVPVPRVALEGVAYVR